jgi:Putative beta-barrel porin-2, OmpL-like. bbp2
MKTISWKAVPAAVLCIGMAPMTTLAQQPAKNQTPARIALLEPPVPVIGNGTGAAPAEPAAADPNPGPAPATASPADATPGASTTTAASASAATAAPVDRDGQIQEMAKEMADMKARMELMEAALKASGVTDQAASAEHDADSLRAATGGATRASLVAVGQAVAAPPPAATPAPPEITAETTTKSAPFPGDWTWLNSGGHNVDSPMSTKYFTPEIRFDANYILDYNHPKDDSMGGSTEMFRSDEWQLEQVSVGGDFRIQNVRGRILTMDGLFATTTPRNDGSPNRGQWDLDGAYRYFSEAWGGYHWDVGHGLNADAGIFVSYIGLFSYYNFDNWTYQPSYVSSNTPWFFNGLRIQYWPTEKLKIEPWIINGWQSYARYNGKPGLGGQILWRPTPKLDVVWNDYGLGEDDAGFPGRSRVHADYSVQYKIYDNPNATLDKIAWTLTGDAGCEYGGGPASYATTNGAINKHGFSPMMGDTDTYNGGVDCHNTQQGRPKQMFVGTMSYLRFWFKKDIFAMTLGGGLMNNPGRYLTLLPPINGATAISGTPYFTENAGDRAQMHDGTITLDYMPRQFITFRLEEAYRYSDVPYWTGRAGITPPGGDNGNAADYQCAQGGDSGYGYVYTDPATGVGQAGLPLAEGVCSAQNGLAGTNSIWWPDLRTNQTTSLFAILVRF